MEIVKILWFSTADAPENKGIKVYQEKSGFYYLDVLAKKEGFTTPFFSIEEMGVYLDKKLTLIKETCVDDAEH